MKEEEPSNTTEGLMKQQLIGTHHPSFKLECKNLSDDTLVSVPENIGGQGQGQGGEIKRWEEPANISMSGVRALDTALTNKEE